MRSDNRLAANRLINLTNASLRSELTSSTDIVNREFPALGQWDRRMEVLRQQEPLIRFMQPDRQVPIASHEAPQEVLRLQRYRHQHSHLRAQDWKHDPAARLVRTNLFYENTARQARTVSTIIGRERTEGVSEERMAA
jgi:hypothetical protein